MNLQKLIGKIAAGQVCRLQVRYSWYTPYVTVGNGSYTLIKKDFIDFKGNITLKDLGSFDLSVEILNSREYEMNLNGNFLKGTYAPANDWDFSVDHDQYKGTIHAQNWKDGLWLQPNISGIGPLEGVKVWIGL